jgi:HPr kinase/phosphorylase
MELRGIGVINVRHIYGVGAIKPETAIVLVVHMEHWVQGKAYDRLGLESERETILGVELPRVTIPVTPGRNLAVILELAAMNNRQKKMGFNAAEMLAAEHDLLVNSGTAF